MDMGPGLGGLGATGKVPFDSALGRDVGLGGPGISLTSSATGRGLGLGSSADMSQGEGVGQKVVANVGVPQPGATDTGALGGGTDASAGPGGLGATGTSQAGGTLDRGRRTEI